MRVSLVNNRSVHFRHVDHAPDYVNFSIHRGAHARARQHSRKRRELRKTSVALIISDEREKSARDLHELFSTFVSLPLTIRAI